MLTQGSVLRPQPWAGETQLLQSCCCLLEAPPHALPKGRELLLAEFKVVMWFAFPFEKAGMGPAGGVGLLFGFFPIVYCAYDGDEINTKSRGGGWRLRLGVDGGADCRKTSFPACRLHHPHRHARHDAILRDGTGSGLWPFKKSGFRRCKNNCLLEPPSKPFPMGWGLLWQFLSWSVRVENGASGWGKNKKGTPLSPNLC